MGRASPVAVQAVGAVALSAVVVAVGGEFGLLQTGSAKVLSQALDENWRLLTLDRTSVGSPWTEQRVGARRSWSTGQQLAMPDMSVVAHVTR